MSRTGHSLALGCLHKYIGGLATQQNLTNTVGILIALAQDPSSTVVQLWAIYSFSLVALSSGPMFRDYVEPVLTLCLRNLLTTNDSDVSYATGKLVGAITLTIGPELQSNSSAVVSIRNSLLTICSILTENDHHAVKSEAVSCFQQLHLFAPRHVNLSTLVPFLCESLISNYDVLRKASISCLRQLTQREAREVLDHASNLAPQGLIDKKVSILPENGLEGALFCLLDTEIDVDVINNAKETLISLLQNTVNEQLGQWLTLCKEILVAVSSDIISPNQDQKFVKGNTSKDADLLSSGGGNLTDDTGEEGAMKIGGDEEIVGSAGPWYKAAGSSRYVSRCFAVEIVRKIIATCNNERAHFDLALARELQLSGGKSDYLVLHLSDLIRMSFMAATSNNVDLRLAGLACLQDVITNFAKVPEPEFPGHVILEQFQAQVGAALRPAFTPDTPSHVTAAACQVCSSWIGSGVARDLNDLRRVHQLLTFSLEKMNKGSVSVQLYNESTATLEKLAILKAWAEVYIMASSSRETKLSEEHSDLSLNDVDNNRPQDSLLQLVEPELAFLIDCWINALCDYAVLSLPSEFIDQGFRVPDSQNYFTLESDSIDTIRNYYRDAWPQILLSTSIWLNNNDFEIDGKNEGKSKDGRFVLIIGSCMEALCNPKLADNTQTINSCLQSLNSILTCSFGRIKLVEDYRLIIELLNVLHRVVLTRDNFKTLMLCTQLLEIILTAAESCLAHCADDQSDSENVFDGGEGTSNGKLEPGNSVVYAALEVCLCQLVKQVA
uniref:HEAT repeat-containing protein 5B n=1 Tax=Romanomermis culicivorax TaxID=13658 RepID=A0A915IWN5_ROMCU